MNGALAEHSVKMYILQIFVIVLSLIQAKCILLRMDWHHCRHGWWFLLGNRLHRQKQQQVKREETRSIDQSMTGSLVWKQGQVQSFIYQALHEKWIHSLLSVVLDLALCIQGIALARTVKARVNIAHLSDECRVWVMVFESFWLNAWVEPNLDIAPL